MKLKYLIPFIGMYFIWNDIPHYENERLVKPLQGNDAFFFMVGSTISTIGAILLLALIQTAA